MRKTGRMMEHSTGSSWLRELYGQFAPVREEAKAFSEEEIDAAIDDAIEAVRSGRFERRRQRADP
jgi:hypothetical protein